MNQLWLCAACGREGASREALYARDMSCGTWAVRVDPSSVVRGPIGSVRAIEWTPDNPDGSVAGFLADFAMVVALAGDAVVTSKTVDAALASWRRNEGVYTSRWPSELTTEADMQGGEG